jgi:hypothetical protein
VELINATRMVAGYTLGMEPDGRELLVVVVKGTFRLPPSDAPVRLHEQQLALTMADTFTGAPGLSAPLLEMDFAPRKPVPEVLLQGCAHAPQGIAAARVPVGLRIGGWQKSFAVVGNRYWQGSPRAIQASEPVPFITQAISYDTAFGGTEMRHADPARHAACARNPVGRGFQPGLRSDWLDGTPLPNTEELGKPVSTPDGDYRPMAFGPLGRAWEPRRGYAGTYDAKWLERDYPFLPADFNALYHQGAPSDQHLPVAMPGQPVVLINLTPDGHRAFVLPAFEAPVHVFPRRGARQDHRAALDTIAFEPDHDRFCMTWRLAIPLRKTMLDIAQVLVGRKGEDWWRLRSDAETAPPPLIAPAAMKVNTATAERG